MNFFKSLFNNQPNKVVTPTMLQMEATECGAASLRIVLAYHKVHKSLEELRDLCGVSRDGSNALSITKVANQFGLKSNPINIDIPKIRERVKFPAILFWNFNHFLVLEGYNETKNIFYVNDPASGRRQVEFEEFDKSFTGIVLNFEKKDDFKPMGSPPKVYSRFIPILRESKYDVLFIALVTLMLVIPGLAIPVFTKTFIDDVLIHQFDYIVFPLVIGMVVMLIFQTILQTFQRFLLALLGVKLSIVSAVNFMTYVLKLPMTFFGQRFLGDIADRINLNEKISMSLSNNIAINIINLLVSVIYGIALLTYDVELGLIVIGIIFFNVVLLKALKEKQNDANQVVLKEKASLLGLSMNGLSIIDTIKANAMEHAFFKKWAGYQAKMLNAQQKSALYSYILNTTPAFLNSLSTIAILFIGGYEILNGNLTIGTLIAFQSLAQSFSSPISNLVGFSSELQLLRGDVDRVNDVFNYEVDPLINVKGSQDSNAEVASKLTGFIEIKDMSFSYDRLAKPIFENINLTIEPGMMLAIIGASGCGKSTVIKLLSRLHYPTGGEIQIDGYNINQIDRHVFAGLVSVVNQNIVLFPGTIRDNLTFWDNSLDKEDIYQALQDVGMLDFVQKLPGELDYIVDEDGRNFSGGQRQCLEIARALVSNPSILILDEATSALDSMREFEIIENLKRRGCTCIFSAHRLSAIRDAHKIIVLDAGKIMQTGIHHGLIQEEGIYQSLMSNQ